LVVKEAASLGASSSAQPVLCLLYPQSLFNTVYTSELEGISRGQRMARVWASIHTGLPDVGRAWRAWLGHDHAGCDNCAMLVKTNTSAALSRFLPLAGPTLSCTIAVASCAMRVFGYHHGYSLLA
jgi:hypothetical protein